ncbi:hypothetical protein K7G98_39970, partial [Saccharothrix sp. MB29]|nr:hypothetical protein [Saccharothrix sp. MB29]
MVEPVAAVVVEPVVTEEPVPPVAASVLAAYGQFTGTAVQVAEASRRDLIDGLVRLVEVEGPVLGSRLHTAYVRSSGSV